MKYVRTKNGIYETENNCEIRKIIKIYDTTFYPQDIKEGDLIVDVEGSYEKVIKQSDTIEELCDGFIFKNTDINELHFLDENSGISLLGASLFKETLRGFIETDKGLIYVAKMNDKGELELENE